MDYNKSRFFKLSGVLLMALCGIVVGRGAMGDEDPIALLQEIDAFSHVRGFSQSKQDVVDYEVGLGAMQKQMGAWQFKNSVRINGERVRYNWQVTDGFSSEEVYNGLVEKARKWPGSELLFQCAGRTCGNGAQWANNVFGERLLYGQADAQRYSVFRIGADGSGAGYYLIAYAAARTADRQYLHAEMVREAAGSDDSAGGFVRGVNDVSD